MALPSVPAQFDTTGTRTLSSSSKVAAASRSDQDENFDINMYKTEYNNSNEKKSEPVASTSSDFASLFQTKQKSVLNLRTINLTNTCTTSKEAFSEEPSLKRRKLKIKPVSFSVDVPTPSMSTANVASPIQTEVREQTAEEQGKKYLKEVRTKNSFYNSLI